MSRRFEAYRVKTRDNLGDPEFWNKRFEDIDARIALNEDGVGAISAAADRVEALALDRVNLAIVPLVQQAQTELTSIPELFRALSPTLTSVGTGEKTFYVEDADRLLFIVSRFMSVQRIADPDVSMSGTLISYDRATGELVLNITAFTGSGTWSDWNISIGGQQGEQGTPGLVPRGAYQSGVEYQPGDVVRSDRSAWVNISGSTGVAPPTLPTTANANWELLVQRGADGAPPVAIKKDSTVVASANNQTTFTIPGGYDPTSVIVALDGILLAPADYTATNGTTVVLASGAGISIGVSEVRLISLDAFSIADALATSQNLGDLLDPNAALTNLGATTVGKAVLKAADAAAARSAIGAVSASHGHAIDDVSGLQSALDAKALASRTISAGGIATGGGNLTSDRSISVPAASQAEAEAGSDNTKAMTPQRVAQAVAAYGVLRANPDFRRKLAAGTISALPGAIIDLSSHLTAGFRKFRLKMHDILPVNNNVDLCLGVSNDAGANLYSTGYRSTLASAYNPNGLEAVSSGTSTQTIATIAYQISNTANLGVCGWVDFEIPSGGYFDYTSLVREYFTAGVGEAAVFGAGMNSSTSVNGIWLFVSGGNANGSWTLYGEA